jgi:7-cyano-7-deazaguanine synthase
MPDPIKNDAVLLASGGLDSTTLAYWLVDKNVPFTPAFIDYGQHCRQTELETLTRVLPPNVREKVEIVRIGDIYRGCRSRLIAAPDLWSEDVKGDDLYLPYRNLLMLYGTVSIEMPFRTLSKAEVAAIGLKLGAPIAETYSCQAATTVPCGACPNCVDRAKALRAIQEGISTAHVQR